MTKWVLAVATIAVSVLAACVNVRRDPPAQAAVAVAPATWDARSAAAYLDRRQTWWMSWQTAARDHGTSCVSCHTALPYALARPALRQALGESQLPPAERKLIDGVTKRVRLWKEVDPFYPDQTGGMPKTSESRGTEAVLNALILATQDARNGANSDEGRLAFANLWALQFKNGNLAGAWAWLNFHNEPWEADDSPFFGAALAAIAIGTAPGDYAASPEIQARLQALRGYLQRRSAAQPLLNRVTLLWASSRVPSLLSAADRRAIIDAALTRQRPDGGWSASSLGTWKRSDNTAPDTLSDGYATGLIALALQQAGQANAEPHVARALDWLARHQDRASGGWLASSLNRQRDPSTDIGKFMNDAATAYAVLALTQREVR